MGKQQEKGQTRRVGDQERDMSAGSSFPQSPYKFIHQLLLDLYIGIYSESDLLTIPLTPPKSRATLAMEMKNKRSEIST